MDFTEKALVLKVGRFRDSDVWVRLLTPGHGVFQAFAFGGSRSVRRFGGCLDTLNMVLFTVGGNGTGTYRTLKEGSLINGFSGLRADNRRLGAAANCARFAQAVQEGPQDARRTFDLLVSTLEVLEHLENGIETIPMLFRVRLAFDTGYGPELLNCVSCGRTLDAAARPVFHVERGGMFCEYCRVPPGNAARVHPGTLRSLDWIRRSEPENWPKFSMPPVVRREGARLVEQFVAYHLGLQWDNGRYIKV